MDDLDEFLTELHGVAYKAAKSKLASTKALGNMLWRCYDRIRLQETAYNRLSESERNLRSHRGTLQQQYDVLAKAYDTLKDRLSGTEDNRDSRDAYTHREKVAQGKECGSCYYSRIPGSFCPSCGRRG